MGQIGVWCVILGIGSFVLNMLGREFILLMWIDLWGPTVGLAIRIGLVILGVVLIVAERMILAGGDSSEGDEKK